MSCRRSAASSRGSLIRARVVALAGKKKLQQAMPPVPEDSVDRVKEDVQWTKTRAQQGRR
jgi:hypothetical protein